MGDKMRGNALKGRSKLGRSRRRRGRSHGAWDALHGLLGSCSLLAVACGPTVNVPSGGGSEGAESGGMSTSSSSGEAPPRPEPPPPASTSAEPEPASSSSSASTDGESTGAPAPAWEDVPPWTLPDECAWLGEEQAYCLLVTSDGISLYGVDSGLECDPGFEQAAGNDLGMAWIGMSTAGCVRDRDGQESLQVTRLETGATDEIPMPCGTATSDDDQLFIGTDPWSSDQDPVPTRRFLSYESAAAGDFTDEYQMTAGTHRFAVDDGVAWLAWHSTDELIRYSLSVDEPLETLLIPEHDRWVHGLAPVNDLILIGTSSPTHDTLAIYDKESGALLEERMLEGDPMIRQLTCRSTLD